LLFWLGKTAHTGATTPKSILTWRIHHASRLAVYRSWSIKEPHIKSILRIVIALALSAFPMQIRFRGNGASPEDGATPCDLMDKILRERLVENQGKIEMFEKTQALMERALVYLSNRAWRSANIDGLCDHFQSLVGETGA
jgi:hypothetical protein